MEAKREQVRKKKKRREKESKRVLVVVSMQGSEGVSEGISDQGD
ncbi:hypothetical protein [Paenibacillus silvae]|nr:hypothetical protein [Paenibacillus silvae]